MIGSRSLSLPLLALTLAAGVELSAQAPDAIYHGGRILSGSDRYQPVQAMAVRDGRITALGSDAEVRRLAAPGTRQVDLRGRTVIPGFYDNHIHLAAGTLQEWRGALVSGVPEWLRGVEDVERLKAALAARAASTPRGQWIQGSLMREDWPNQKVPTRWDLDAAAPDHPVAITRGPHTVLLNSRALAIAGITRDTPDPPGGWIIRDERGEPNGRVLEAAKRLVDPHLPRSEGGRDRSQLEGWRAFLLQLRSLGVTSVNAAGLRPEQLRHVQELYEVYGEELPRMTAQIRLSPGFDSYDDVELGAREAIRELESLGFRTGFGDERLRIGAIKMSIDGGLSAPVMWTTEPYATRPGFSGVQRIPDETFYTVAKRAHDLGWQLGIHTIGDGATVMVVDQIARILRESPRADHRHFLHHVTVRPPERTMAAMASNGIIVATHPSWTTALGGFAAEALAGERLETQNPSRSLLDRGIRLSYGSDAAPYGPLFSIWNAVTRMGWDGRVYGAGEAVTVEEALRLHTLGSAFMTFDDERKGSLEVGKLADFVVLGQDILGVDPERIREIPIEVVVIGGREFDTAR